jgi:hypothetical protein
LPRLTLVEGLVVLAIIGVLAALAESEVSPWFGERAGLRDAEADLAAGTPRVLLPGRRRCPLELIAVTKERVNADVRFTGCCPTPYGDAYARAYHARLEAEIRKRRPTFDLKEEIAEIEREADARHARN